LVAVPRPTHYDILGVGPNADVAEIREAYRRGAREHHPDHAASSGRSDGDVSMPAINEAYRVLNDPARRAVYDASLRGAPERGPAAPPRTSSTEPAPTMPTFPSHLGPARFPWRSVSFVAMLAIIGIVVLAQFTEPGEPQGPDGILRVGSCVMIEANGDAREVL
jgi:curved DNA-binding protein CbpA